ncbi:30S ribosomal protein S6e [Candidatus Woesearchaeota archaeon]|nr:30S ribosomal protein S6e [Candidatus Woesearchaeota archaeon]
MASFKLNIADSKEGKCYKTEIKDAQAAAFMGLNLGEKVDGSKIGMDGYELEVAGGTDYCGFPMRKGILGERKRIAIYKSTGFKGGRPGMRKRKTVCGHKISDKISAINLKVLKVGSKKLVDIFGGASGDSAEKKEEAPKEEKKEAPVKEEKKEAAPEKKEISKEEKKE